MFQVIGQVAVIIFGLMVALSGVSYALFSSWSGPTAKEKCIAIAGIVAGVSIICFSLHYGPIRFVFVSN